MTARTVLITGGSSGIGAAAAHLLLANGHRVAVTGRNKEKLDAFLDEAGRPDQLLGITADATDWHSTEAAVASTVERFGGLDAAVANAGFTSADTIIDGDPNTWHAMVLTNVLGPALLAKAALPHLQATLGRLVFISAAWPDSRMPPATSTPPPNGPSPHSPRTSVCRQRPSALVSPSSPPV